MKSQRLPTASQTPSGKRLRMRSNPAPIGAADIITPGKWRMKNAPAIEPERSPGLSEAPEKYPEAEVLKKKQKISKGLGICYWIQQIQTYYQN